MADFYDTLSQMENEAMRRARRINAAEHRAAERFRAQEPPPPPPPCDIKKPPGFMSGLFGAGSFGSGLFSSPDLSLIMLLCLILGREQSDPLLTLALVYILM
ncbi:MAG: hypothetical protein IKE65_09260 [Clostridia bacterium]|nr:hypothetical protein [Clostridia bacterium]